MECGQQAFRQQSFAPERLPVDGRLQLLVAVDGIIRDDAFTRLKAEKVVLEESALARDVGELVAEDDHSPETENNFKLRLMIANDDVDRPFAQDGRVAVLLGGERAPDHELLRVRSYVEHVNQMDRDAS